MTTPQSYDSDGNILGDPTNGFHSLTHIEKSLRITGTGALTANVLQFTGAIQVVEQYAVIESITTLVNGTDVYADIWDGTVATDLTKTPGSTISGFEVGSFFLKDKDATNVYSTMRSDQARFNEVSPTKAGAPFILNQKYGVDSFIRFHLTTTDAPVDFNMMIHFEYRKLSENSSLTFL